MDFAGLGAISDLLTWMIDNPTFGASLLVATGPFVMTCLTAWFFEARVVSLFHGQSRSFFPGEVILCLTMIALVYGAGRIAPSSDEFLVWWSSNGAILSLAMASVLLWLMRKIYDAPIYNVTPGATANSASKIAHDICGYLWYPFVIVSLFVPLVYYTMISGDPICVVIVAIVVVTFGCWLGLDAVFDASRKGWDLRIMHPDDANTWYRRLLVRAQDECNERRGVGDTAKCQFVIFEITADKFWQKYLTDYSSGQSSCVLVHDGRARAATPLLGEVDRERGRIRITALP